MSTSSQQRAQADSDDEIEFLGFRKQPPGRSSKFKTTALNDHLEAQSSVNVKRETSDMDLEAVLPFDQHQTSQGETERGTQHQQSVNDDTTIPSLTNLFDEKTRFDNFQQFHKLFTVWHAQHFPDKTFWTRTKAQYVSKPHVICSNAPRCGFKVDLQKVETQNSSHFSILSANVVHSELCVRNKSTPSSAASHNESQGAQSSSSKTHRNATGHKKDISRSCRSIKRSKSPFQVGKRFNLSDKALKEAFFEWHNHLYPDKKVFYRPYKRANGLNPYFICKSKRKHVCGFRVLFHPLLQSKGFRVALSDTEHSSACMPFGKDAHPEYKAHVTARRSTSTPAYMPRRSRSERVAQREREEEEGRTNEEESEDGEEEEEKDDDDDDDVPIRNMLSSALESDEEYFPDDEEEQHFPRVKSKARAAPNTDASNPLGRRTTTAASGTPSDSAFARTNRSSRSYQHEKHAAAELEQGHPQESLRSMGVHETICERFALHGIKKRGQLTALRVGPLDFDGVCEVVCTKEPFANGDTSRIAAHIAKRRVYPNEA